MTLLIMVFAAIIATVIWYRGLPKDEMKLGTLCLIFWGAALMWLADAIMAYIELGSEYFSPAPEEMLNDIYLGLSAVALGMIIWLMILLYKDPKGVLKAALFKTK